MPRRRADPSSGPHAAGRVAIGVADEPGLAGFVGDRPVVAGFELGDEPWRVPSLVCVGRVVDDGSHAAALDAALRGADVVADVTGDRLATFVDDVTRSGLTLWSGQPESLEPEWAPLLEALAGGVSIAEAARMTHLSIRSAHRRLAVAREVLKAPTTAAAVARWSARRSAG